MSPQVPTFVFTDIEASTRMWLDHPTTAAAAIALHDQILSETFEQFGGRIVKNLGDGVMAVFSDAQAAVEATAAGQRALIERESELGGAATVRMAAHSGAADARGDDLIGLEVNRCQRIMASSHGGQILVSASTAALVDARLPPDMDLVDLGEYRLPSLDDPQRIYQLTGPGLRRDFPPLDSPTTFAHNLPEELSSFVGRSQELAELDTLLRSSRLVTLTGEGGIGKSRLALRSASRLRGRFPDGVWTVDLSSVDTDTTVAAQVASSLGVRPTEGSPLDDITDHLAPLTTLVILDNCEHILSGVADLLHRVLRQCRGLTILATSRERIGLPGEVVHRVPPMKFPSPEVSVADARRCDAVQLFVERAALVAPGFRLGQANVRHVADICRRLDGVPLAIELVAAKAGAMTPDEMVGGLARNLDLLARNTHQGDRHHTLRAAALWSFRLLSDDEQHLFQALSIFRGGFDATAVGAVVQQDRSEVLAGLSSLADKSLIRREPEGARFRMLEPLRVFAAEELDRPSDRELRAGHASFFANLADEAYEARQSAVLGPWLDRLERDQDNLHAAFEWALEAGDITDALRIAIGTTVLWKQRGQGAEGRGRLERALTEHGGSLRLRARGHLAAGDLSGDIGEIDAAREHLETAHRLGRELGDRNTIAWSLARLASIPHKEGDLAAAHDLFEDALDAARSAGDDLILSHVLASLSLVVADRGDVARAKLLAEEAVTRSRTTGNAYAMADALLAAGEIGLNHGTVEDARLRVEEALDIGTREGLGTVIGWSLAYLGRASVIEGELQAGKAILEKAVEEFDRAGTPMGRPWAKRHLALVHWMMGEAGAAETILQNALEDAIAYVRPEAPLVVETLGWVLAAAAPRSAALLLGCASSHLRAMGLELAPFDSSHSATAWRTLGEALSAEERSRLWAEGATLDLGEAARAGFQREKLGAGHSRCL